MFIFIRNIPKSTTIPEIRKFLESSKGKIFNRTLGIKDIRILVFLDKRLKHMEYHCLVKVDSDKMGNHIIRRLNSKTLNGVRVHLREYQFRSYKNDRRNSMDTIPNDLRKADRRRGILLEEVPHITEIIVESYDNSRKLL